MNKKSQITMFVIFGLLLLIIVIILLAIRKAAEPRVLGVQNVLNELETGTIKNHVTSCIVQITAEGIEKIGANGGVIYDFEQGTIPFADKALGEDYLNYTRLNQPFFVAYGLKENRLCTQISYNAPDYPYPDIAFDGLNSAYEPCLYLTPYSAWDGFFGQNTMNKLCSAIKDSSCQGFARGAEWGLTIQKQLEDYIAKKIPACVNFSAFSARMPVDIITESAPRTEINIYDSEVGVAVKYPVKIIFEDQEPVTQVIDYYTTVQIRLGRVYNFLYNLLSSKDSKEISFDITNQFIESSYYKEGLLFTKINNPCTDCSLPFSQDDIVEVHDKKSIINGRPFLFRAAVRNRKPALNLIQEFEADVRETNFINLPLEAYDPDDAGVTYYFLSLRFGRGRCAGQGSFAPFDTAWCEHDSRVSESNGELARPAMLSMPINKYDSGEHRAGILVLDDSGLFDYQWFLINITDTTTSYDASDECVAACETAGANINNCDYWCTLAANQCRSECGGGTFTSNSATLCGGCIYPIYYSGTLQTHADCSLLSRQQCINNMPDCFWVREKNTGNTFIESCYNDIELTSTNHPAYIVVGQNAINQNYKIRDFKITKAKLLNFQN